MDLNRKTAFQVLMAVEKDGAYSNIALNSFIKENNPESPAFVRELVYGVLENKKYIDFCLDGIIPSGIRKVKTQPLILLRMGIYQLSYMDSVPKYAAINETVKLAKKFAKGRDGFINGVLRGYTKKEGSICLPDKENNLVEYLSVKYSFDEWIVKMWLEQHGSELCERLLESMNQRPKVCIRVNVMKITREELADSLSSQGFETEEGVLSKRALFVSGSGLLDTEEYRNGLFSVQDEASIITSEATGAKPMDTVLDMCAAPGGKSLATAELMNNQGVLMSFDVYQHKLNLIEKEAARLGLDIIRTSENDGCIYNLDLDNSADCVLVDGPCSGLGVIRRKPEIKYKKVSENAAELAEKQLKILVNSARYVKPAGTLVYSTCTINKLENEDVAAAFLEKCPEYELVMQHQYMPCNEETDGFYISKFIRKEI